MTMTSLLLRIGIGVLLFAGASALAVSAYGRFADRALGAASSALAPQPGATSLDRLVEPLLAQHPGESGMILVEDNLEAYALRARSARQAERSLDVMYYIWHADHSGAQLARELIAAADRGARVRLLLDDNTQRGQDRLLAALDSHPRIEVRLFNPGRNRSGYFGRGLELLLRATTLNRRMHNKAWIADNRVAIVGGRNIGDEYFDGAEQLNFMDVDLLLVGPAVAQASEVFDRFWNSHAVIPVDALAARSRDDPRLAPGYVDDGFNPAYAAALDDAVATIGQWLAAQPVHWSSRVEVITDPPEKALIHGSETVPGVLLVQPLFAALDKARDNVIVISPYFVPGAEGTRWLSDLAARIHDVSVLTNSLAASDVALVHAGYSAYRQPLLAAGVGLHELTPDHHAALAWLGSSSASLHTKAFVVDDTAGFVGSFNFDPRSTWLNTEMGVLFEDSGLARQLRTHYERALRPGESFELFLDEGRVRWRDGRTQPATIWTHDPDSSALLRAVLAVARWLPIESQL